MKKLINFETKHNPQINDIFHQLNSGNIGNVIYWWKLFEQLKSVPGDIVECGIGRGRSLIVLNSINQMLDKNEGGERAVFGYDSFEGFPEPATQDLSHRAPQKGDWSYSPSGQYKYTPELLKEILKEANVEYKDINIVKGFFGDTLKKHPNKPIALLHLDGDLYQSYKDILEYLYNKVAIGGILVFDDFLEGQTENEKWPGARLAVKEFLGDNYKNMRPSPRGNYYYIKTK